MVMMGESSDVHVRDFLNGDSAHAGHALRQAEDSPDRPRTHPHASPDRRCEHHLLIYYFYYFIFVIVFLLAFSLLFF
jgi:hypothetical protein